MRNFVFLFLLLLLPAQALAFSWGDNQGRGASVRLVVSSHVDHVLTGTTGETTLWSFTLPAGTMGPNGTLRITTLWSCTSSANTKVPRIKMGGTAFYAPTITTAATFQHQEIIHNRNSTTSQVAFSAFDYSPFNISSNVLKTGTVDTNADQTILISGQLQSGAETMTLHAVAVELLQGGVVQ